MDRMDGWMWMGMEVTTAKQDGSPSPHQIGADDTREKYSTSTAILSFPYLNKLLIAIEESEDASKYQQTRASGAYFWGTTK